jgi:hypothetical protein
MGLHSHLSQTTAKPHFLYGKVITQNPGTQPKQGCSAHLQCPLRSGIPQRRR